MPEAIAAFWGEYGRLLITGTLSTLAMTGIATLFAYLFGLPMGVILVITQPGGIRPSPTVNRILGWIVNIGRSLPFIILIVAVIPLTRIVMGTSIHVRGAIFPLVLASAPFVARMVESSLAEVDAGVIEAAQSMGATTTQIVFKVYLPEALPSLVLGASISLISILSYTAIAGVVGAGGLGDIAKRYGYERGKTDVMWVTVALLIVLVQIVQSLFSLFSRKIDKRIRH
jgi:D-methionine transport system permease protein